MNDQDYTPDFVEVLNAWEQHPPLQVEFVFDLPPESPRKSDKVGVLMYQAVLLRQDHPELEFGRLKAVTFTMDVHRTGDELENAVGHDLPHYRNAAARLDAFHINLGPGQVLIVTDELANASLSPSVPTRLAAWEMLRTELGRCVAVARLADAGLASAPPEAQPRWQALARNVWTEYFCGYHAAVEGLATDMARQRLREALEQDPAALAQAAAQFERDRDLTEFATRAEGCVRGLCEAMAEVMGQLAVQQIGLAGVDPQLDTLIRAQGLSWLWELLIARLRAMGFDPLKWPAGEAWEGLVDTARQCLARQGLHYGMDGEVLPAAGESEGKTT